MATKTNNYDGKKNSDIYIDDDSVATVEAYAYPVQDHLTEMSSNYADIVEEQLPQPTQPYSVKDDDAPFKSAPFLQRMMGNSMGQAHASALRLAQLRVQSEEAALIAHYVQQLMTEHESKVRREYEKETNRAANMRSRNY